MFQSAFKLLQACVELADDLLDDPADALDPGAPHPDRRQLRWERVRRAGAVPAPPVQCLCPVRTPIATELRDQAVRY